MKSGTLKTIALTLVTAIVVAAVIGLGVVESGVYNVAATEPHQALTESILSSMMGNSVRHHASDVALSPTYRNPDLDEGFEHFQAMCVACHGAPGVEKNEIGEGLNPPAPDLTKTVSNLSPREVFWILKNGIKMTGMPAFGPTHSDEKLWNITAFVERLPDMTREQYSEMAAETAGEDPMHHHH
jgi:mono/diheme cytochrome c family protein